MLVSIIIPTYNRSEILGKALESALNQTYEKIEVVVVDDGSNDNTKEIVNDYIGIYGNKLRYFYKENGGVSSARNLGIYHSRGEYISFLDSDDCLFSTKIQEQVKSILKYGSDVCYCTHNIITGIHSKEHKINYKSGNILLNYLKNKTTPHTNAWLINRNLIEKNQLIFRENCSWGEDMEFFVKILAYAQVSYVKKPLFEYIVHENGMLSDFSWNKIESDVFIWNNIWNWLEQNVDNLSLKRESYRAIYSYRIPALIIYRLSKGINDMDNVRVYMKRYEFFIKKMDFSNGLRSLKLWIYYLKLKLTLLFN